MKENLSAIYKMEMRKCINIYGYTYADAAQKYEHRFAEGDLIQNIQRSPKFDIIAAEIYDYYRGRCCFGCCRAMALDAVISILSLRSPTSMNEMYEVNYHEHGQGDEPYTDSIIYDGDLVHEALFETIGCVVDYAGPDLWAFYGHLLALFSQTLQVYFGECRIVPRDVAENGQSLERTITGELSL